MSFSGKTMFISGASRGIGLAIAKRVAADGANVALVAKTTEPHPKLPGTIYTAAKEIEEAGGQALPIVGDVRDGDSVAAAVAKAVEQFGGIDICVNNAIAINLGSIEEVPLKRFDLMNGIQVRGTYAVSQACIPHMKGRENPHILTLSPPIRLEPQVAQADAVHDGEVRNDVVRVGYCRGDARTTGIASNTLWPRTMVATAAVQNLLGGDEAMDRSRKPEVYADAAYAVLSRPAREYTGHSPAVRGRAAGVRRHRPVGLRLHPGLGAGRGPVGRHPQPAGLPRPLAHSGRLSAQRLMPKRRQPCAGEGPHRRQRELACFFDEEYHSISDFWVGQSRRRDGLLTAELDQPVGAAGPVADAGLLPAAHRQRRGRTRWSARR